MSSLPFPLPPGFSGPCEYPLTNLCIYSLNHSLSPLKVIFSELLLSMPCFSSRTSEGDVLSWEKGEFSTGGSRTSSAFAYPPRTSHLTAERNPSVCGCARVIAPAASFTSVLPAFPGHFKKILAILQSPH